MDDSQLNFNFKNREALLGVVGGGLGALVSFLKKNVLVSSEQLPLGGQGSHQGLLTL